MGKGEEGSVTERRYATSLSRGIQLLETFRQFPDQSVSELARRSGLAKSSAVRLAAALATEGFLARDEASKRYRLGLRLWELGTLAVHRDALLQEGRRVMRQVAEETEETVVLAVLDGIDVLYIDKIEGTRAVVPRMSTRNPAHAVSSGVALLSCLSDDELRARLPETLPTFTEKTIGDRETLIRHLADVRANGGLVVNRGEFRLEVGGIAMPIFNPLGQPAAALGLSCPLARLTPDVEAHYSAVIRRAARTASGTDLFMDARR